MPDARRILLYGDVDLQYTDGSAVWLTSMARALTRTRSRVSLLLKARRGAGGLFEDLAAITELHLVDDFASKRTQAPRYQPGTAARRIEELVTEEGIDVVVCRGFATCLEVARQPQAGQRLWAYMTDIPQRADELNEQMLADFTEIASSAQRLFAQTDEAREFLEHHVPAARQKTLLLPPMLPDALREMRTYPPEELNDVPDRTINLVYAGKFARGWNTLEMCDIPQRAARARLDVRITMIGDKFQRDPQDATWVARMKHAIENSPGVRWLGGMSRQDTLREVARHDISLAWRHPDLDSSHEISTKLLEYLACGVPPLVNRTAMHERLLGDSYPFFIDRQDVLAALSEAAVGDMDYREVRESSHSAIEPYWVSTRADALETELSRTDTEHPALSGQVQVELIGDETFRENAIAILGTQAGLRIQHSKLTTLGDADRQASMLVIQASRLDSSECEGRPVWVLWHKGNVTVRRPAEKSIAGVLVTDPSLRLQAARWAGVPIGRVFVLPDATDMTASRPKVSNAEFTVGVIVEPDDSWAVSDAHELLSILRAKDPRFTLQLFLPESCDMESRPLERELMIDATADLAADPRTNGAWLSARRTSSSTWLREVGWLTGSQPTTIRDLLGQSAELSGTVVLRPQSAATPSLTAQELFDTLSVEGWSTASKHTTDNLHFLPERPHDIRRILSSVLTHSAAL